MHLLGDDVYNWFGCSVAYSELYLNMHLLGDDVYNWFGCSVAYWELYLNMHLLGEVFTIGLAVQW